MWASSPSARCTSPTRATGPAATARADAPSAFPVQYFAEGTTRPGFDSYICIQNPGEASADVTITYMKGDGGTETQNLTVAPASRSTVTVKDLLGEADDSAHDFSAKVECTNGQQIIAERPMYFNYRSDWTGGHDEAGLPGPAASSTSPRARSARVSNPTSASRTRRIGPPRSG